MIASFKTYGLPALVMRGANTYGPYQYPEKLDSAAITNAIDDHRYRSTATAISGGSGPTCRISPRAWTRCFATARSARSTTSATRRRTKRRRSISTVSRQILRLTGKPQSLIEYVVDRPAHDRRYRVDPSKLQALGWQPRLTFAEGLAATVEWYVENQAWWRSIKSGEHHQAYYAQNYADRSVFKR